MALPLLMAMGAGILGGGQYLLKKQDQRKAQSLIPDVQSAIANSPFAGTQYGMQIENYAQAMAEDGSLLNRNSGQIQALMGTVANNTLAYEQNQQAMAQEAAIRSGQAQQAMQNRMADRAFSLSDQLDQDYRSDLEDFGQFQDSYRKGMNAINTNSSADALAAAFNFYNLIEPGGIVRDDERGEFKSVGGAGAGFANLLNEIKGKGLTPKSRKQLEQAMNNQYKPRQERARRQFDYYQDQVGRARRAGYNVASPIGSQGIDWSEVSDAPLPPGQTVAAPVTPKAKTFPVPGSPDGKLQKDANGEWILPPGWSMDDPTKRNKTNPGSRRKARR